MASEPKAENMFNVKDFDELTGLIDTIFSGEECAPGTKYLTVIVDNYT